MLYAFWMPAGSAYNVDAVLAEMVAGLRAELAQRRAGTPLASRALPLPPEPAYDDAAPGNSKQ